MIQKLLIANRGEIAARIARTARRLGVDTVAVYSDPDAEAVHVRACDEAVALRGATATETYLNIPKLLDAARRAGCDAVHPGYGFLSERAELAQAVIDAGLIWVGPRPESILAMGGKVNARARMIAAGVPVVPGSHDPNDADRVGYPLMIKADAGGGGRGMRLVHGPAEVPEALASAQREALGAFGSDRVFLERFIARGKHIEVQILGDTFGRVIALYERDCSAQRRHQKVIEEAPSPSVSPALRAQIEAAAVRAAEAVNYVGAGTVELLLAEDGAFYFLEMNTRIQVEHPVTEAITGWDLVEWQLRIAAGEPLPAERPALSGAAIEARLYAEDPAAQGQPQAGTILDWSVPTLEGLRIDAGVTTGSVVSVYYDPMLAKLIVWAPTREEARQRLIAALRHTSCLGVRNNKAQLLAILRHPDFVQARHHTRWIETEGVTGAGEPPAAALGAARLAALAQTLTRPRRDERGQALLPKVALGWRNSRARDAELSIDGQAVQWCPAAEGLGAFEVNDPLTGASGRLTLEPPDGAALAFRLDGHRRTARIVRDQDRIWVHTAEADVCLTLDPPFPDRRVSLPPGSLVAPMPGRVLRVEVAEGDAVVAGQALIVLEAMKTEHTLRAPQDGVVGALRAVAGALVDAGELLGVVG
ncbi:ATP-grasp domain-containing protein [Myxococcota bacterium]|nr:ATP-grasp domain-containing protein [Myxococcota bacterium]